MRAISRLENSAATAIQMRDAARMVVPATMRCRGETHRPSVNCATGAAIAKVAAKAVTSQPAAPGAVARSLVSAGPTPRMLSDVVPITNIPRARIQGTILLKSDCIGPPLRFGTAHEGPSDGMQASFTQQPIHRQAGFSSIASKAADAAQHNRPRRVRSKLTCFAFLRVPKQMSKWRSTHLDSLSITVPISVVPMDASRARSRCSLRTKTPKSTANTMLVSRTAETSAIGACVMAQITIQ